MTRQRIGILGGTFDPVHYGHVIPAQYAFNEWRLDRLLLVPADSPVHRPRHEPAPAEDRLRMCELAAAPLPRFEVSDVEVARPEPSYTVLTLQDFRERFGPEAELVVLVGEDNLPQLHTWRRIGEVLDLATVVPLPRPVDEQIDLGPLRDHLGEEVVDELLARRVHAPLVPISGTRIRRLRAAGEQITGLVPEAVERYITTRGLYAEGPGRQPEG